MFFCHLSARPRMLLADELRLLARKKFTAWAAVCSLAASFFFVAGSISKAASRAGFSGKCTAGRIGMKRISIARLSRCHGPIGSIPRRTIRVDVSATKSPLTSLNFVTLKIKDAVCDKIRLLSSRRPSVDTRAPDIPIQAHLTDREFTLYLDTTGEPLFKRGQRIATGEAPLRENLAAGFSGWPDGRPGIPLLDPMCGSGTILLEAAHMALDIAPGLGRHFAFEKLKNFDAQPLARADAAMPARRQKARMPSPIYGSDLSGDALQAAA